MYFAYFDESGDSGYHNSPTVAFVLATVLISDFEWLYCLDETINFRRFLKNNFGINTRSELKSNWLIHSKEQLNLGFSHKTILKIYRSALRFQRKCGFIKTFAIVINKDKIKKQDQINARDQAWMYAIERLERFGHYNKSNIHIVPDEGHGYFIRAKLRKMRRFHHVQSAYSSSTLPRMATNIVEDSSDRKSHESAYAAYRKIHPCDQFPNTMWDVLGDARVKDVNRISGGEIGIVDWP